MTETRDRPAADHDVATSLEYVKSSFENATALSGGIDAHRYEIAGKPVEFRFAARSLRETVDRPFAHLAAARDGDSPPALTVNLWDSRSTGADAPPLPPVPQDYAEGALFHYHEPPVRMAYQPGLMALSVLDARRCEAWHWVEDASAMPYWDQASPIRQILFWWLSHQRYLQVHGAAVGTRDGGVLVVGRGGSGKSTTALSCLGGDMLYAGDDYVAITLEPSPRVASIYSSGKLEPHNLDERLPHLRPLLANGTALETEKAVVYLDEHFPAQMTAGFPLRAVLVPSVVPGLRTSRLVTVSRAAAFAALAPSTIFQLHTAGPDAMSTMSRLVAIVPCYGLELGSDIASIPATISSLLRDGTPQ
jgi:hypothetical protein